MKKLRIKDKYEMKNLENFERIYPLPPADLDSSSEARELQEKYDLLIHYSKDIWGETAAGGFARKRPELEKPIIFGNSPKKNLDVGKSKDSNQNTYSGKSKFINTVSGSVQGIEELNQSQLGNMSQYVRKPSGKAKESN